MKEKKEVYRDKKKLTNVGCDKLLVAYKLKIMLIVSLDKISINLST